METVPSPSLIQSPINHITRDQPLENVSTPNQNNLTTRKHKENLQKPINLHSLGSNSSFT